MATAELKGAVIGCGYFARNHLHAWKEIQGAAIVAVCDRRRERADACAREFSVPRAFDDAEAMFEACELDFADIVTTPEAHRALVEAAARRGLHVICQKPLAPSLEDGRAMVAACRAAGVRFMVHENFRWQRPMRALKAASARIGDIHFARLSFRSGFDVTSRQPYLAAEERFIIYDLGVHLLDLARFFTGEIERLWCRTARVNPKIRGEDVATILLAGCGGSTVVVELSYAAKPVREHFPETFVLLEGRDGTVELGPGYRLSVREKGGVETRDVSPRLRAWSTPPGHAIQESVVSIQQHWVECLRRGREPETSGEDNLKTLELVLGAYESAASGEPYATAAAGRPGRGGALDPGLDAPVG